MHLPRHAIRNRARRAVALVAVASGLGLLPGVVSPSLAQAAPILRAERQDPEIGVQFHGMWADYTDAQRHEVLDRYEAIGVRAVRLDVSWAMLQPLGPEYDPWGVSFVDNVIDMINSHGMTALVTLWLTPPWANGDQGTLALPSNPEDYARVAQWAAHRYAGKVLGWEVWNEPNSTNYMVGADPVEYTRLLQAAYPAFHAGDPNTLVVFGGVEYNEDAWLTKAYDAGAHGYFDVMSTHCYQSPSNESPLTPDDGSRYKFMHLPAVRALMVQRGDGDKSIWTGMGYSTHVDPPETPVYARGVDEVTQAIYLNEAVMQIRQNWPWVGKFAWYTDRDSDAESTSHNKHFGLLRADLSPKPAYTAMANLIAPDPA